MSSRAASTPRRDGRGQSCLFIRRLKATRKALNRRDIFVTPTCRPSSRTSKPMGTLLIRANSPASRHLLIDISTSVLSTA